MSADDVDPDDAPAIKDHPGPWDEIVNRAILLLLAAAPVAVAAYLGVTGSFGADVTVTGSIPAWAVYVPIAGLYLLLVTLALMKFYGAHPVAWVTQRAHNIAKNYNPPEE